MIITIISDAQIYENLLAKYKKNEGTLIRNVAVGKKLTIYLYIQVVVKITFTRMNLTTLLTNKRTKQSIKLMPRDRGHRNPRITALEHKQIITITFLLIKLLNALITEKFIHYLRANNRNLHQKFHLYIRYREGRTI